MIDQLRPELLAIFSDGEALLAVTASIVAFGVAVVCGRSIVALLRLAPPGLAAIDRMALDAAVGLTAIALIWAAVASGGRSAFTVPALAMVVAIALATREWWADRARPAGLRIRPPAPPTLAAGAVVCLGIVFLGLLYGLTMNPSPREGMQPIPFLDEAFYSVLSRDVARTGLEDIYSPGGFGRIPELPAQTWYHWGELWLAAILAGPFAMDPMNARHYVVLPVLLATSALLCGALTRAAVPRLGVWGYAFAVVALVVMAPLPLYDTRFAGWSRGLLFGITMYGSAALLVLLIAYRYISGDRKRTDAQALFDAVLLAAMIPAHIVLAATLAGGAFVIGLIRAAQRRSMGIRGSPTLRVAVIGLLLAILTVGWGIATGHGIGTSGRSDTVDPFNGTWSLSLVAVLLGGLPLLAVAVSPWLGLSARVMDYIGAAAIGTLAGAVAWGARLGDFTMFHAFFGPLAVALTPAAIIALAAISIRLRRQPSRVPAMVFNTTLTLFLCLGAIGSFLRLYEFGFDSDSAVPEPFLASMRELPERSAVAYSCENNVELAFWNARLIGLDAYSGHPVVPLCFQAEFFPGMTGGSLDGRTISPLFVNAPQRDLFPTADARPTSAEIVTWMRSHGIRYIYSDPEHPNRLVPDARVIAESGAFRLSEIP